ncbi:chemotaxis protein CheA [Intestinimonas sp.]|uniref:chemotaxis protein CheA n=1 Tax=Intestinimonas sp. TaxID=1965293 RepID=UPI002619805F|nr:chemotaxis protein CheA [Intestinimonas sp.]
MSSGNEILDMYIYETNTLLEQLENIILEAEKADTFSQDNVNEIFRIMHTIKGSSAMMEFDTLTTISHRIEDLFFIIRENTMDVVSEANRPTLFDLMFQSIDYFRAEMEKVESAQPLDKNIDAFLSNINSLIAKIKGEAPPESAPSGQEASAPAADAEAVPERIGDGNSEFPYELRVFFDEGCGMENLRSFMLVASIRDFCAESDFLFEPSAVENDASTSAQVIEQGFLLMFKREGDREKAISVVRDAGSVRSYQPHDFHPAPAPAVEAASPKPDAAGEPTVKAPAATPTSSTSSSSPVQHPKESLISVNLSKLDMLSAIVGEIVITESMVTASPDLKGLNLDTFSKNARQLRKLTDELQDISMSLRMVPMANTFQKMNRIVRDMSKKLNKQVKLTLVGEDTEVDKTIVDSIGDPIMHMIRNSMDHGIEDSEEERIAAGKDPVGEITLSAQDTGNEVIIMIRDDGQGVNDENVLKKAIKSGLASPDVEYSHREILNFLMMPGFSTNATVTEFSGRGVGMDVVKKGIEELGGSVSISSEMGHGMTTIMRIPLTMAIMDGMEVSVGDSIFTIPINNIRQSFKVSSQDILRDSVDGEMIRLMDHYYPVIRAKDLYRLPGGTDEIGEGILLWLESGDYSYCLFVDELLGEQKIVVKPLPAYINNFDVKDYGIMGCSILGDGNISIILDAGNLYAAAQSL